ncbi:hypothetical protein ACRALDRAFT_207215 [Sodiomyces alcalophilus JCM 7366]|uniref:uncharacterized protein n=1 Tax=Sodiomyces alcalophilus JCM 7366 TaxID=591952 RepID=UPI0039B59456
MTKDLLGWKKDAVNSRGKNGPCEVIMQTDNGEVPKPRIFLVENLMTATTPNAVTHPICPCRMAMGYNTPALLHATQLLESQPPQPRHPLDRQPLNPTTPP